MLLGSEISDQNLLVKRRLLPCSLSVMAPVYYFLFYNYYSNILNFIDQQAERIKIADLDPGYFSCHSSTPPNLWSRARVALTTSIDFFLKLARRRFFVSNGCFFFTHLNWADQQFFRRYPLCFPSWFACSDQSSQLEEKI